MDETPNSINQSWSNGFQWSTFMSNKYPSNSTKLTRLKNQQDRVVGQASLKNKRIDADSQIQSIKHM